MVPSPLYEPAVPIVVPASGVADVADVVDPSSCTSKPVGLTVPMGTPALVRSNSIVFGPATKPPERANGVAVLDDPPAISVDLPLTKTAVNWSSAEKKPLNAAVAACGAVSVNVVTYLYVARTVELSGTLSSATGLIHCEAASSLVQLVPFGWPAVFSVT